MAFPSSFPEWDLRAQGCCPHNPKMPAEHMDNCRMEKERNQVKELRHF
jgi:hypothetical protein